MTKKQRAAQAVALLAEKYPEATCSLTYKKPYELLIATRLAAQCTDARVNVVTRGLFAAFPTLESLAQAEVSQVEELVHSCGLYKTKARDIVATCRMLVEEYGGQLPDEMDELLKLPGVGRKTANLVLGDIYGKPAVVCDTHCIRITNLLGLIDTKDPHKAELQLQKLLPPEGSSDFCHRLVWHGRETCVARRPDCDNCCLLPCCKFGQTRMKGKGE